MPGAPNDPAPTMHCGTLYRVTRHLFVYGTLLSGLRALPGWTARCRARRVGEGTICARLYDLGRYPGAVAASGGQDRVHGEVYALAEPEAALRLLDDYEGCDPARPEVSLFVRSIVSATMGDGRRRQAWAYFFNGDVSRAWPIAGGDWRKRR